jgi:hypothetical protein
MAADPHAIAAAVALAPQPALDLDIPELGLPVSAAGAELAEKRQPAGRLAVATDAQRTSPARSSRPLATPW